MNNIDLLSNLIKNLIINNKKKVNNKNINLNNTNILSNYNNKWDYTNIIYNNNNTNLLNNLKNKYLIKKYISYIFNHKLNNLKLNIFYKEPIIIFNNNLNKYQIILFIYKPKNNLINVNSNELLITKLIHNLISTKINNFEIKPIILTYDYLDSNIYSKLLSKHLSKFPRLDTIKNIKIYQNILNKILLNKLNKQQLINNINTLISSKLNFSNSSLNNTLISKNISIYTYLLHQYLIGNIWKYKGKNFNSESNARSLKSWNDNKLNTSLSQTISQSFKLNYYLASITKSQSSIISKNGKYNVKVAFNHF